MRFTTATEVSFAFLRNKSFWKISRKRLNVMKLKQQYVYATYMVCYI